MKKFARIGQRLNMHLKLAIKSFEGNLVMKIIEQQNIGELEFREIQQELSTYTEKNINKNGTITTNVVKDSYFLVNDIWNIDFIGRIANFKNLYSNYKYSTKNIRFETNNPTINMEFKYVWYRKLFQEEWSLQSTFIGQANNLRKLTVFLNKKYPTLFSLLDLDIEKAEREWMFWLNENGVKTHKTTNHLHYGDFTNKTSITNFLKMIYSSLFEMTDTREEWEKDRWNVRILNRDYGISFNQSTAHFYVDFTKIERVNIREQVKKYIKHRLLSKNNFSWSTARNYMRYLPIFINFTSSLEPLWEDFKGLKRTHIEQYICG